ncbi:MAG: hypothetical protein JXN59_15890 [Anaerolineae bacterium]|nr:hypothetical protein [Anaerolineae bacterium]
MPTDSLSNRAPRPHDLWRAWEETAEYVARLTKQETVLHLTWNSQGIDAPWMAQFNWVGNLERVNKQPLAGEALSQLWKKIDSQYTFFQSAQDARRAPAGYDPGHWFNAQETAIMQRLLRMAMQHSDPYCTLLITQQVPASGPALVRGKLICHTHNISITGQSSTLLKVCQDLYPRIASQFGHQ